MRPATAIALSCLATLLPPNHPLWAQQLAPFEELSLEIKASPASILPMEAVRLHIRLTNPTNGPAAGHACLAPAEGMLTIHVAAPGEPFRKIHPSSHEPIVVLIPGKGELPPGFEATHLTYLWWGETDGERRREFFPVPGLYSIKAALANFDGKAIVESNAVTITVTEPGPPDSGAWQSLREQPKEGAPFVFALSRRWEDPGEAKLKDLIERFPKSTYATYARYALGRRYRAIAKDSSVAWPLLERTLSDKDFPFRDQVLYDLLADYLKAGQFTWARRHLDTLKADYPDTDWPRDAEALMAEAERR